MNTYIPIILITIAIVHFLNHHNGQEVLFRLWPFGKKGHKSLNSYLTHEASPYFAKLCSCYYCQGAHIAHILSWLYGWWAGIGLVETCYTVVLATIFAASLSDIILGFLDDVRTIADSGKSVTRTNTPTTIPAKPTPQVASQKEEIISPTPNPNALEEYVAERKARGYDIELSTNSEGKPVIVVGHVPERERIWEEFCLGHPNPHVSGLKELWDEIEEQSKDTGCTRCDKRKLLADYRNQALRLIDAHLASVQ